MASRSSDGAALSSADAVSADAACVDAASADVGRSNGHAEAGSCSADVKTRPATRPFVVDILDDFKKLDPEVARRCGFRAGSRCFRTAAEAALVYARYMKHLHGPTYFEGRNERNAAVEQEQKEKSAERKLALEKAAERKLALQARAEAKAAREVEGVVDWLVRATEQAAQLEATQEQRERARAEAQAAREARKADEEIAKIVRKVVNFLKLRTVRAAEAEARAEAQAQAEAERKANEEIAKEVRKVVNFLKLRTVRAAEVEAKAKVETEAKANAEAEVKARADAKTAARSAAKSKSDAKLKVQSVAKAAESYLMAKQARARQIAAAEAAEKATRKSELDRRAVAREEHLRQLQMSAAPPDHLMPLAEAERLARAEGLELVESSLEATGYQGVRYKKERHTERRKPYYASTGHGKGCYLGAFSSIPEAALAYARHLGPAASTAAAAAAAAADETAAAAAAAATVDPHEAAVTAVAAEAGARVAAVRSGLHRASDALPLPPPELAQHEAGHSQLRPAKRAAERTDAEGRRSKRHTSASASAGPYYTVESLLATRTTAAGREFLVRWLGFGTDQVLISQEPHDWISAVLPGDCPCLAWHLNLFHLRSLPFGSLPN